MAGPIQNLNCGWEIIRKEIHIQPPEEAHLFLGCIHERALFDLREGKAARGVVYNMESYLESYVERYKTLAQEITGQPTKLKQASTPFLVEDKSKSPKQAPCVKGTFIICPWCKHLFTSDQSSPWSTHSDDMPGCPEASRALGVGASKERNSKATVNLSTKICKPRTS